MLLSDAHISKKIEENRKDKGLQNLYESDPKYRIWEFDLWASSCLPWNFILWKVSNTSSNTNRAQQFHVDN